MNLAPVKAAAERESLDPGAARRLIHRARGSAKLRLSVRLKLRAQAPKAARRAG